MREREEAQRERERIAQLWREHDAQFDAETLRQRDLRVAEHDAYIRARSGDAYADAVRRMVEGFPPLSAAQRARVIVLLNPPHLMNGGDES